MPQPVRPRPRDDRNELHVYVHLDPEVAALLRPVPAKLELILSKLESQGAALMAIKDTLQSLEAELVDVNVKTTEIGNDIDDLAQQLADAPANSEAADRALAAIRAHKDTLIALAAKHTPGGVVEPPAEPA